MDTFIIILVLIVLFVLLGGAAWFFGKEAVPGSGFAWLTGTRHVRSVFSFIGNGGATYSSKPTTVMVDDSHMQELAEELRSEILRTVALSQEFDSRLHAIEADLGSTRQLPETLDTRLQTTEVETRRRLAQLRQELVSARTAESPYSQRRHDAVRELYQKLAQIEVALGAVVNPMLLPGEPVSVPETLDDDTLKWNNWGDVADRAYAFGEAFSKQRVVLEPDFARRIEAFISTFREALTGTVYPIVQSATILPAQKSQMRAGIVTVVDGITPLRREFEETWLQGTMLHAVDWHSDDATES